jgi:HD-GYP domain-containing protein (c-di-GMP phosphodiesterase class II)
MTISIADIKAGETLPYDLYLYMERNQKLILYRKKNQQFEEDKLKYFQNLKMKNFYIKKEDQEAYAKHTAENLVNIMDDEGLSEEEKTEQLKEATKELLGDMFSSDEPNEEVQNNMQSIVKNIVTTVSKDSKIAEMYEKLQSMISDDGSTFSHSLNVSTYSVMFAFAIGIARSQDVSNLGIASILHDVYLATLPKGLIDKYRDGEELNTAELMKIRKHPNGAEDIIKQKYKDFNPQIIWIIRQHHEQPDGLGYPLGLKSENISVLSKVLAIADLYDNTVRISKVKKLNPSPSEIFSIMKSKWKEEKQIFEMSIFSELVNSIGVQI